MFFTLGDVLRRKGTNNSTSANANATGSNASDFAAGSDAHVTLYVSNELPV